MRHAVFVVPFRFETSLRFLRQAMLLPGVAVSVISQDPLDRFEPDLRRGISGFRQVKDSLDARQIARATQELSKEIGVADCLIGVLEQLQVPLAEARAALSLPGLSVEAAHNFRDKSRMKDVLRQHDVPCARHQLARTAEEVGRFVREVGMPIIIKPPAGAGAKNTFRLNDAAELREALAAFPPNPDDPMLLEEFIIGEEHSFDAVCIGGRPVWHSIGRYYPTPLEVMENEWMQWCVLLPREISGPEYEPIRRAGAAALKALGMDTGLCHMEWFRREDGSVAVSEVGARPPGAQFTSLISWAHDHDMYEAWARLVIGGSFDPPERKYAVGAAYLRGRGGEKVSAVHGVEEVQRQFGSLVVEAKLPKPGQPRSSSYEGEGYVILRHPETSVVADALKKLVSMVRVELA